jgi:hypothetical protein
LKQGFKPMARLAIKESAHQHFATLVSVNGEQVAVMCLIGAQHLVNQSAIFNGWIAPQCPDGFLCGFFCRFLSQAGFELLDAPIAESKLQKGCKEQNREDGDRKGPEHTFGFEGSC